MKTVAQTVIEADHFYTIAAHTGNVIQAVEGTKEAGTVRLGKYEHKPEQEWSFIRVGDGVYRIRNRASGKLIDLMMTGTANGTWLHLWEDVGGTSQMWTVQPTPEGTVRLRSSWAGGKCVDTSMGITPLEGVIMGTRSGSMDPAVVQYIANNDHMTVDEVLNMCNKKSGLLGISGLSSDMRDIDAAADSGHERAIIARDMLIHGIRKYIGSYAAVMNGVDVIVFTAGIGENGAELREKVMEGFEFMGAKLDPVKNVEGNRKESVISADDSKVKICVIPTDEEIVIARDTLCIVTGKPIE